MKKRWISLILAIIMAVSLLGSVPVTAEEIPDMHVSEAFLGVLKKMEGFYPQPYWDYGQYSIGYGSYCCPLKDGEDPMIYEAYRKYMETPITEEEATQLLINELAGFEKSVNNFIKKHGLSLKQHQFDALVSFSYNCGAGWTNELTGYLNTAVRLGDVSNDLIYGMCLWSTAGGQYILIPRRMSEANMYINGEYKSYTEGNSYPSTFKYVFLDGNGGTAKYKIHGYNAADPAGVKTDFSQIPTGKDANGNWFVYDFAGWFTKPVGGTQVTVLDGSLPNGTTLYAQWKDPSGQIVTPPGRNITFPIGGTLKVGAARRTEPVVRDDTMAGRYTAGDRVTIVEEYNDGAGLIWGKTEDGYWVCVDYHGETYVQYDQAVPEVESVYMHKLPNKLAYVQRNEELDITGSVIVLKYKDGSIKARTLAREFTNVTKVFDNTTLGKKTITATFDDGREHQDFKTTFEVEIIKATVTFKNYDGTVLSQQQYAYGEAVSAPGIPSRPEDDLGAYRFVGWDKEITACTGNAEYTAVFEMIPGSQKYTPGDINSDTTVNEDDVIYLLRYVVFPERYPITIPADYTSDGMVNEDDVIYLLRHVVFPERYPLAGVNN